MPSGPDRARAWRGRKREWPRAGGWSATASLAVEGRLAPEEAPEAAPYIAKAGPHFDAKRGRGTNGLRG